MSSQELVAAFQATTYRVDMDGVCFDLRIGVRNPAFDQCLRQRHVATWAVITACNPGAVRADEMNPQRQWLLQSALEAHGWIFLPANNIADRGEWPDEPGFLVLDARQEEMTELAAQFAQCAFVYGSTGSEPTLVWI